MRYIISLVLFLNFFSIQAQKIRNEQLDRFDFKQIDAHVKIDPFQQQVRGKVLYEIDILGKDDSLFINGKNMQFENVLLNGKNVNYRVDKEGVYILFDFIPGNTMGLSLEYTALPRKGIYFINWDDPGTTKEDRQVWTQGQGKYTSHWLPSLDDMNDKAIFDLQIEFPEGYEVVANGEEIASKKLNDSVRSWEFVMKNPMSSYLVAFAAGNYRSQTIFSSKGVELKNYYQPKDSLLVEPTYRHSARIMDFFEKETGVPYPWTVYKQIPVQDFLYAGMENTGTTIFSESLMVDSTGFHDQNYVNVNAHELAHQWFGNLVTQKSGTHHWLHEGFATYYALLAEKEIFGEDYFYWKLYQWAEVLKELSDTGKGQKLVSPTGSSSTYYQKGAWALHILREITGEVAFKKGVKNYLEIYAYKNVETSDFLHQMELASGMDLTQFKKDWLEQSAFKASQSLDALKRSPFIRSYLELAALIETPLTKKYDYLDQRLDFPVNDYLGQEVVYQLAGKQSNLATQLYEKAFDSNNMYVRQAIASSMQEIPVSLKSRFESLLLDDSYLTVEKALFALWERFPNKRAAYLNETRDLEGFYQKNIRMLWLTLNLVTPGVEPEKNATYYTELSSYTHTSFPFEVRENAFGYLYQLGAFDQQSLRSLLKATNHHTYRFRNFSRQLLDTLMANGDLKQQIITAGKGLEEKEVIYLNSKL